MRRLQNSTNRRGLNLVELMVVIALFNLMAVFLFVFYRSANVEFEEASTNMGLSQYARIVSDRILPYASTAIPISTQQANFIYSPTGNRSNDQANIPNIYNLDFVTSTDFLSPNVVTGGGGSFDAIVDQAGDMPAMAIVRRGYSATQDKFYRYRIRFDVPTMRLWLERVNPALAVPTTGGTVALPAADTASGSRPPKMLGYDLNSVEFGRVDNCVSVRISVTQLLRVQVPGKSRWFQGQQLRNNLGQSRDENRNTGSANRRGREIVLYTTVLLPVYTGK